MSILSGLKPQPLWNHFEKLCGIPHPSKHEQLIGKFLADWGRSLGLETILDETGNVIIRKPATKGMEDRPWVCLQAHMDMVPQKNADVAHDFLKDPIKPRVDGNFVRATGTTLGADNGIGVAAAMAVLDSKDLAHGPIEVLITVDEEAGMTGAKGLKPGILKSKMMLNLDSESDEELCVGCAGGMDTSVKVAAPEEDLPAGLTAFSVRLSGLRGGHSGIDIHLGRGNSNILLTRLLWEASEEFGIRLCSFAGGDLRNVIPRESKAVVAVASGKAKRFARIMEELGKVLAAEFSTADPDMKVEVAPVDVPAKGLSRGLSRKLLSALFSAPNAVSYMSADMPGLTETSSNLAAVRIGGGEMTIISLQRSAVDTRKFELGHRLKAHFELIGAEVTNTDGYSGWKPNPKSPLLKLMVDVYKPIFGKEPKVAATHGGLECGILMGKYPGLDAISMGANLHFPHSPDEHVEIDSVGKFWNYLVQILKQIPKA